LIITSDNPRDEEPMAIITEVQTGVPDGIAYEIEPDREKAIRIAAEMAEKDDIILVSGKGHECSQEIKGRFFDFDDRRIISGICAT
jgi:UDP-N-acetylmuramoyl-L-alanyl-D-glutamate--2,6-diaminopimelate ligase